MRRDIGKDSFVARADNEVGTQYVLDAPHLLLDLEGRAMVEHVLCVNPAQESDFPAKIVGQSLGLHVPCPDLERMEAVNPGVDQPSDNPMDRAAGVEDDLAAMGVALPGESAKPGQDKLVEQARAEDEVELGAEVIPKEETVDKAPGKSEKTFVGLKIETADTFRDRVDDIRVSIHLN